MTQPITMEEAMLAGYSTVTRPYKKTETEMLEKAMAQFRGADVVQVHVAHGIEIWRAKRELRSVEVEELSAADVKNRRRS